MSLNVAKELAALEEMTIGELQDRYAEVFDEPVRSRHRRYLIRRILWRLQAQAEGDLSERARKRAVELAKNADVRVMPPRGEDLVEVTPPTEVARIPVATDPRLPPPGGAITRKYKNGTIRVLVTNDGFEFRGEPYKSLSAVARAITGSPNINGFLFFRLGKKP